jgi:hypothetical protein
MNQSELFNHILASLDSELGRQYPFTLAKDDKYHHGKKSVLYSGFANSVSSITINDGGTKVRFSVR